MIIAAPQKSLKDPEFRLIRKVLLGLTALNIIFYLTISNGSLPMVHQQCQYHLFPLPLYAIIDVIAVYSAWVLIVDTSGRSTSVRVKGAGRDRSFVCINVGAHTVDESSCSFR